MTIVPAYLHVIIAHWKPDNQQSTNILCSHAATEFPPIKHDPRFPYFAAERPWLPPVARSRWLVMGITCLDIRDRLTGLDMKPQRSAGISPRWKPVQQGRCSHVFTPQTLQPETNETENYTAVTYNRKAVLSIKCFWRGVLSDYSLPWLLYSYSTSAAYSP